MRCDVQREREREREREFEGNAIAQISSKVMKNGIEESRLRGASKAKLLSIYTTSELLHEYVASE